MSDDPIELAGLVRRELAGRGLPPQIARLYSQHTRLLTRQPGLGAWRPEEAEARLQDAVRLLEAGFVEREAGRETWAEALRRAAEILEWLAHPELNPQRLPLRLLAAAAYQIAGYPARAAGLLDRPADTPDTPESRILRCLLQADFARLLATLAHYWAQAAPAAGAPPPGPDPLSDDLQALVTRETASALGVICAFLRWGEEDRLARALARVRAISGLMAHGYDGHAWLTARLCAEAVAVYVDHALRRALAPLADPLDPAGRRALERYARLSYRAARALAWPSQLVGLQRLADRGSFALCTPTGSGKTTVAEVAILQSLFAAAPDAPGQPAPLAVYIVPSRALAAEVESRLAQVFRRIRDPQIVVTGLYGGTDWGPTDAWLGADSPTVLICTYEKSEALVRFLGPQFLRRVSLILIDEAHQVQFEGDLAELARAESRALRLEVLSYRLFGYLNRERGRVIALSAVAAGFEQVLSDWVTGQRGSAPARAAYRSTRQLIGRLEHLPERRFAIRYDLMDHQPLQVAEEPAPVLADPIPALPLNPWAGAGPDKRLRAPLLWAALHLAGPDQHGRPATLLISVTQRVGDYADDFLLLLGRHWEGLALPGFFRPPGPDDPQAAELWGRCLQSCADYYGRDSREQRLLERGVVLHHGKMPGPMSRLLLEVVRERIVRIVLATSTLSEGINLPFETILIPSLRRGGRPLGAAEFANLAGRAGRPGVGTEGRTLVLLPPGPDAPDAAEAAGDARGLYFRLLRELAEQGEQRGRAARSPLAELIGLVRQQWGQIAGGADERLFLSWLEGTAPLESPEAAPAVEALDSLDSILLASVVEVEEIAQRQLAPDALEEHLRRIWARTYARYASDQERALGEYFVRRGRALRARVYPDAALRRRLYRTNLPPRAGRQLLAIYAEVVALLRRGAAYAAWDTAARLAFVRAAVAAVRQIAQFRQADTLGRRGQEARWDEVLAWWLCPASAERQPGSKQISDWHDFVSQSFSYRFNWGLGSVVALALDDAHQGHLLEPTLESWPLTRLPWVVFWLKELITWGTLDPAAAYLLSRGQAATRAQAEALAQGYYAARAGADPDDLLDAARIRDWAAALEPPRAGAAQRPALAVRVELLRDFGRSAQRFWRVLPVPAAGRLYWYDPAGFALAAGELPADWRADTLDRFDFTLDAQERAVLSARYV